jgi:hypothetical protein
MGYRTCLKYVIFANRYVCNYFHGKFFLDFWKSSEQIFFISVPYAVGAWALRCGVILLFPLSYHCVQSSEQKSAGQFCNSAQNSDEQCFRKELRTVREIFLHQHTEHSSFFWFLTLVQHSNKRSNPFTWKFCKSKFQKVYTV